MASLVLLPALSYKLRVPDTTISLVASLSRIICLIGIGTSWLLSANSTFFILSRSVSELNSCNTFLLVSLRVWDDWTPGVHCRLVPALKDGG